MNSCLRYFLLLQAALAVFYLLWRLSAWWEGALSRRAGARRWSTLGKVFLIAAMSVPLLCVGLERLPVSRRLLPGTPFAGRILGEIDGPGGGVLPSIEGSAPTNSDTPHPLSVDGPTALLSAWALGALGLALFRARQYCRLRSLLAGAVDVRRAGLVEILVYSQTMSPFATRVRGLATVVVPSFLVESGRWREAVLHELQHHRQGDPWWTLLWDALTVLLWVNPAVWWWRRRVFELQELACDECLLERGKVSPTAYGETLLDVAEALSKLPASRPGACCPTLAGRESPALLTRRLDRILNPSLLRRSRMIPWIGWFLAGTGLWVGMAAGLAAGGETAPVAPQVRLQADLQKLTEEKLSAHLERFAAHRGVVVAMDPSTGAVLARAGFRRDETSRRMVADEAAPFTLRFPGASTMKPLVVAGALQAGVVNPSDTFDTGSGITLDGKTYREWKEGGLGRVSPADIIVKSSNLAVLQVAQRLGTERLSSFLDQLGFAIPKDAPLADLSIGTHSGASVTGQQLAHAYSVLVNGGRDPGSGETIVRTEVSDFIRKALVHAVEEGTGTQARCPGCIAGGKTGTSIRDIDGSRTGTALFVGVAPADSPKIVISIIVDDVGNEVNGNQHAASLFREIVENGLPLLEKPRTGIM